MLAGKAGFAEAFKIVLRDTRNQALRWMKWHTNARATAPALSQINPQASKKLSDLVARMMEKDPAQRIASAQELVSAIRRHFSGQGDSDAHNPALEGARAAARGVTATVEPTAPIVPRSRLPLILSLSLVGLLALAGIAYLIKSGRQSSQFEQARLGALTELNSIEKKEEQANTAVTAGRELSASDARTWRAWYQALIGRYDTLLHDWGARDPAKIGAPGQAHKLWCQAMVQLLDKHYEAGKGLLTQCDDQVVALLKEGHDPGGLTRNAVQERQQDAATRIAVANELAAVEQAMTGGNFHDARAGLENLRERNILLLDSERNQIEALAADIDRRDYDSAVGAAIAAATARYSRGQRTQAIKDLNEANTNQPDPRYPRQISAWRHAMLIEETANTLAAAEKENRYDDVLAAVKQLRSILTPKELADLNQQAGATLDQRERDMQVHHLTAQAQQLETDNKADQAADLWAQVLSLDPGNKQATARIGTIDDNKKFHNLVDLGDADREAHNWADAIGKYTDALKVRKDAGVSAKIADCAKEIALQRGRDMLAAGNLPEARQAFEEALVKDPANDEAKKALAEMDRRAKLDDQITRAGTLIRQGQFRDATDLLVEVQKQLTAADPDKKEQVKQLADKADYLSWLRKAQRDVEAQKWQEAAVELLTLRKMSNGNTPAVEDLWKKVQPHVAQPDNP